ncbi:amino acid ABC transporter permease [Nonomuraea sp. MCN248]|uniref:Amino acid ABC transporter permease n=1 Tax=Nonomuraea corallina TaxID=2989783 RepID=A0ABT4SCI8_9ACTN|nr:amino acid ABC transporter permease [Nonomuraea corallina]MDA0634921.1 amino acid ABC transporter permease [Nonomuraea corallina]
MADRPKTTEPAQRRLSPRKRQRILRGVQYVILVAAVVALALWANWPSLAQNFARLDIAELMLPDLFTVALLNTIIYSVGGFAFSFVFGLILALMRLSTVGPYRWLATLYIEIFRGVPALLVFLLILFLPLALQGFSVPFGTYGQAILGLGLVGTAYQAEIFRAGLQAVPKGQTEAARSLGMSATRAQFTVVVPQAIRIVIPPTTNQFVSLLKDSSLVLFLGVSGQYVELTKFGNDMASTHANATPILVAGLTYLIVTVPLGYLAGRLEKRKGTSR